MTNSVWEVSLSHIIQPTATPAQGCLRSHLVFLNATNYYRYIRKKLKYREKDPFFCQFFSESETLIHCT